MPVFFSVELGNLWPQSAFIYYISIISMETCTVAIYWVASSLDHKMCMMDFLKAKDTYGHKKRKKFYILYTYIWVASYYWKFHPHSAPSLDSLLVSSR